MKITNLQLTLINYSLLKCAKANFKDFHSTSDSFYYFLFYYFLYTKQTKNSFYYVQQNSFLLFSWNTCSTKAIHSLKLTLMTTFFIRKTNQKREKFIEIENSKDLKLIFRCLYQNLTRLIGYTKHTTTKAWQFCNFIRLFFREENETFISKSIKTLDLTTTQVP